MSTKCSTRCANYLKFAQRAESGEDSSSHCGYRPAFATSTTIADSRGKSHPLVPGRQVSDQASVILVTGI